MEPIIIGAKYKYNKVTILSRRFPEDTIVTVKAPHGITDRAPEDYSYLVSDVINTNGIVRAGDLTLVNPTVTKPNKKSGSITKNELLSLMRLTRVNTTIKVEDVLNTWLKNRNIFTNEL